MPEYPIEIKSHLESTVTQLQAAKDSWEQGRYGDAVAHAAESAFHTASTLLLDEGIETSQHGDVITLLQQVFVQGRRLTKEQGADLGWLLALRRSERQPTSMPIGYAEAQRAVQTAESFFKAAGVILDS
jgi:uncharacterized protein (UPF0332 family)